jgi:hypothetical protein
MPDTPIIPMPREGFDWLIVVPPQLTHRQAIRALEERFGVFCHYKVYEMNPDKIVIDNDRPASMPSSYGVWVRPNIDADPEFSKMSAIDLQQLKVSGITLLERLVLELYRFVRTGRHGDVDSLTLCTGSRHPDGCIPTVYWAAPLGRLEIHWVFPHIKGKQLRCRAVAA